MLPAGGGKQRRIGKAQCRRPVDDDQVELLARLGDDLAHRGVDSRSAGLGGSGPLDSSDEIGVLGLEHMVAQRIVGGQQLAEADLVDRRLERRLAKVGCRSAAPCSRRAKFCASASAVDDLPSPDWVLVTSNTLGIPVFGAEAKRGDDRRIGFRNDRRRVFQILDEACPLAGVLGTTPRHGRPSLLRTSSRLLDRVVEEFEADRRRRCPAIRPRPRPNRG